MKVLVVPNPYRDGPSAPDVASAMSRGIRAAVPHAEIVQLPLADGGDGTLAALRSIYGGKLYSTAVRTPLGISARADFGISDNGTIGLIEMAQASGLRCVSAAERDPFMSSTQGTGDLIMAVLDHQVKEIIIGVGGSATIDVGAGALSALGVQFLTAEGVSLAPMPADLLGLKRVEASMIDPRVASVAMTVLSDVTTSIKSNSPVYGKQKGVRPATSGDLDNVVQGLCEVCDNRLPGVWQTPGSGAGGGLAGALAAFCGASVHSGAEFLLKAAGFHQHLMSADLVLTGEGRFDATTFHGKLPHIVARIAAERSVPCISIVGTFDMDASMPAQMLTCIGSHEGSLEHTCYKIEAITSSAVQIYLSGRVPKAKEYATA